MRLRHFVPIIFVAAFCIGMSRQQDVEQHYQNSDAENEPTFDEFVRSVTFNGYPIAPSRDQYNAFIKGLPIGLITTKQEAAMALAHFIVNTYGLIYKRESACATDGCPGYYENAACDIPDQDYYERGYAKIAYCDEYRAASRALFRDDRLVMDPDMIAREDQVAWETAFWIWATKVHNLPGVSNGEFGVTTKALTVDQCGIIASEPKVRFNVYKKIRELWNLTEPAIENGCYL